MKYRLYWNNQHLEKLEIMGKHPQIAMTTREVQTLLKRTRRQIYRYIKNGLLHPHGPFLGEWLFEKEEIFFLKHLLSKPKASPTLPSPWQFFFPEYPIQKLSWWKDKNLILGRLLDQGEMTDLRLLLRTYSKSDLCKFLETKGSKVLSLRNLRFWCWFFRKPTPKLNKMVSLGQKLGGVI